MRSTMMLLVVLAAGCAPVPPGDVVGGRAEWVGRWTDPAPTYTGDVSLCVLEAGVLRIHAGVRGESLTVAIEGDAALAEWDATRTDGAYIHPDGAGFLQYPLHTCEAHVGTGAGEWIVDLECTEPDLSAHIVITGCERR